MATNTETFTNPRDNLPNTYTDVAVREIDFVSRFGTSWQALQEVLGIMNPIKKQNGTQLVSYKASVTLTDGDVDAGCVIPYSKKALQAYTHGEVKLKKYATATPIEDVEKYGAQNAIVRTDDAFLQELQSEITTNFYTFLQDDTEAMTGTYGTFQMACSMAIGKVRDKFKRMRKSITDVVLFVNTLDAYEYLGNANISTQTAFGLEYVQNFLGARTVIISSDIEQGKVIAVPAENIVLYYVDPSDSEFAKMGLVYTTDGDTNLIGFHVNGNYGTAVGENFAIMGMTLWCEYADGVAVITIDANPLKAPTIAPVAGSEEEPWGHHQASEMQNNIVVANGTITGDLYFIEGGLAPSGPLAGDGYFMFLQASSIDSNANSLMVGLQPSAGTGLQELINDPDKSVVMKIAGNNQKFVTVIKNTTTGQQTKSVYTLNLNYIPADENIGA